MKLIDKLRDKRNGSKIILAFIFLICTIIVANQYFEQRSIAKFQNKTTGRIIDFKFINMMRYYILYEYTVENVVYSGRTGVSFFKCDNGRKGCVGETFTVYYSEKNPSYSRIDLGKYEEFNRTVEFFD